VADDAPRIERLTTPREVERHLDALARLRIAVFREYPYLYDGDATYERRYLATYLETAGAVVVLAWHGARVVGASTGLPMAGEPHGFLAPLRAGGLDPAACFYFGESVLEPGYRGRGVGARFFDEREAHAAALGFRATCFAAVVRPADDPRRPPGHRALDAFWRRRGYRARPELTTSIAWREVGEAAETAKPMVLWTRGAA
jgi:GNAT superfamily N-acetyltransferase